jgi:hypothetical protein
VTRRLRLVGTASRKQHLLDPFYGPEPSTPGWLATDVSVVPTYASASVVSNARAVPLICLP